MKPAFHRVFPLLARLAVALCCAAVAIGVRAAGPAAGSGPAAAKVVWHVDFTDPRRMSSMIQNVNNMVTTYQSNLDDYDVRVVFLAGGIRFVTADALKGSPFEEDEAFRRQRPDLTVRLQQLRKIHNVKFELCEITREQLQLPRDKVIDGVESVRSGVVRIAELQAKGFAYLKVE